MIPTPARAARAPTMRRRARWRRVTRSPCWVVGGLLRILLTEWARKPLVLSKGRNAPSPCEHARFTKAMRETFKYRLPPNKPQRRRLEQQLDAGRSLLHGRIEDRRA